MAFRSSVCKELIKEIDEDKVMSNGIMSIVILKDVDACIVVAFIII